MGSGGKENNRQLYCGLVGIHQTIYVTYQVTERGGG